jgi:CHAT domain-containing protein
MVKKDQVRLSKQPIDPVLQLVNKYQKHLLDGPQFINQNARFTDFSNIAYTLYQSLLSDVSLEEKPLIIAADGPLRFIPFEALVVKKPELNQKNYHQLTYLVNYHPTSYVYSANLWAIQPKNEPKELQVLGFSHSALNVEIKPGLSNELPGTAAEIGILKSTLKGLFFSGQEATKQKFLENAQQYDIIHLAIHGISDSVSRLSNRLLFRDPDHPDQTEALYTYELYNLQLTSRLAVLSACESGVGRNYQGEGVYSMSRAFSYAGCPTTVMSLWRIPDNTTPKILERFYKYLNRSEAVDQALRKAKLNYLSENQGTLAHPAFWAAMVVHGTSEKVVIKRSRTFLIVSILTILLIVAAAFTTGRIALRP